MRTRRTGRIVLSACLSAALAGFAIAAPAQRPVPQRERARVAQREQQAKANVQFQTEKTDSWLCLYVSPFFCSNLYPSLTSDSGSSSSATAAVPNRSRR
jgi:hypothetical protein